MSVRWHNDTERCLLRRPRFAMDRIISGDAWERFPEFVREANRGQLCRFFGGRGLLNGFGIRLIGS